MKIGYVRVSTTEQNIERQEVIMDKLGVEKIYIDKISGKSTEHRAQLKEMLEFIRTGDTVVVESISRLARNTRDLLEIVKLFNEKGVTFVSQKESIDTNTPTGLFMLTVFGAVAELERSYLLQRQREGIEIAKTKGVYKGRKPIEVDDELFKKVHTKWINKEITARAAMKALGFKPSTFYRKVKAYQVKNTI